MVTFCSKPNVGQGTNKMSSPSVFGRLGDKRLLTDKKKRVYTIFGLKFGTCLFLLHGTLNGGRLR